MINTSARKKILMVDDDEVQLAIAEIILKKDYDVVTTTSGEKALAYLLQGSAPHLILLDIVMPHMDGWETFNRLKAISCLHDVPIAFFTSLSESSEKNRAYEMGAVDFIQKPFQKEELRSRVKAMLEKHQPGTPAP